MRPLIALGVLAFGLVGGGCAERVHRRTVRVTPPTRLCKSEGLPATESCVPIRSVERLLQKGDIHIRHVEGSKGGTSGAKTMYVEFPDQRVSLKMKWKESKRGGEGLNNVPRKEIAAFAVQRLFLDPDEYVVPPSVGHCFPLEYYRMHAGGGQPTFAGADCVFGVLTYWVDDLTSHGARDTERFKRDPAYARNLANMNLLTYLIDHRDTRDGNFMVGTDPDNPRVFSIDNGLAFSGLRNPLAWFVRDWSNIQVPALPREQIERLRKITRADLDKLSVIAQYRVVGGELERMPPSEPFAREDGVRRSGDIIQLGLTTGEIDHIAHRLQALLERVDAGKIPLF
jgi:hypothetical protein